MKTFFTLMNQYELFDTAYDSKLFFKNLRAGIFSSGIVVLIVMATFCCMDVSPIVEVKFLIMIFWISNGLFLILFSRSFPFFIWDLLFTYSEKQKELKEMYEEIKSAISKFKTNNTELLNAFQRIENLRLCDDVRLLRGYLIEFGYFEEGDKDLQLAPFSSLQEYFRLFVYRRDRKELDVRKKELNSQVNLLRDTIHQFNDYVSALGKPNLQLNLE